jgi:tripartite-type tricarboxylate transporter receptor subunit TctC
MGKDRSHVVPEVPTADEFGVQGLDVTFWFGLWAPKTTPKPVVTRLSAAVTQALADPTVRHRISDLGAEIPPPDLQTAEAFGAFHKTEIEKWWPFIRTAGIKAE